MYSIVAEESGLLPRERLLQKGAEVLSDQELLAIVLRTGTRSESVLSMANRILKGMTSLADLSRLSLNELQKIPGIGRVKSIELKAMVELAKRIEKAELARSEQIMSSQQVARRMMLDIGDKPQEHLVAIYLDTQNRIIQQKTVFIGGVRRSIAEPREILHYACHLMATSLIVVHNHPSGKPILVAMILILLKRLRGPVTTWEFVFLTILLLENQLIIPFVRRGRILNFK